MDHPLYVRRRWVKWKKRIQRKKQRAKPQMVDIPKQFQLDSFVDFFLLFFVHFTEIQFFLMVRS